MELLRYGVSTASYSGDVADVSGEVAIVSSNDGVMVVDFGDSISSDSRAVFSSMVEC